MEPRLRTSRPEDAVTSGSSMDNQTSTQDSRSKPPLATRPSQPRLLDHSQLPKWMQDNPFVLKYYRRPSNSYLKSIHSLTYLHNETTNIYSHLLPTLLVFLPLTYAFHNHLPAVYTPYFTTNDTIVWACYFGGVAGCLGMSATFHCVSNHSPEVARLWNQADYVGIVALIWGSFVPSLWYGLWCYPRLLKVYLGMISTLALTTIVLTIHPLFRTTAYRPFRALLFIALGLSAIVPVLHSLLLNGLHSTRKTMALDNVVLQGAMYILGAVIYAARVPERWVFGTKWEGGFDLLGSSHQIFHFLVVGAAAVHGVGLWWAMGWRFGRGDGGGLAMRECPIVKQDTY